jgi:hypothetical protein
MNKPDLEKMGIYLLIVLIFILILLNVYLLLWPRKPIEPFVQEKFPLSAGILSYFAPKTLEHTLQSYKDSGLLDAVEDVFVILQKSERQEQEKKVCDSFGVRAILMETNGRMASGFRAIYDHAKMDILLPLENDFAVYATRDDVDSFLTNALYFLREKGYDIVRGRSRKNAGVPNTAVELWKDEPSHTFINHTHLAECIYWETDPDLVYPSKIQKILPKDGSDAWYLSTSASCHYTNNPFLCTKSFFARAILPHLVDGENIEDKLTPLWSKESYKCVFGPGLFTHDRSFDGHS